MQLFSLCPIYFYITIVHYYISLYFNLWHLFETLCECFEVWNVTAKASVPCPPYTVPHLLSTLPPKAHVLNEVTSSASGVECQLLFFHCCWIGCVTPQQQQLWFLLQCLPLWPAWTDQICHSSPRASRVTTDKNPFHRRKRMCRPLSVGLAVPLLRLPSLSPTLSSPCVSSCSLSSP